MRAILLLGLLSALVLAGCATDNDDGTPPATNQTNTTATPTPTPTPEPSCAVPGAPVCITPPAPGA